MGINARVCTGILHPDYIFNTTHDKVLLGDLSSSPEDRNMALNRLVTKLDGNLSLIPSCECGFVKDYLGLGVGHAICPKCHTPVSDNMVKTISPVVFFNSPHPSGLIQPIFLSHFKSVYNKRTFDTLRYLVDTTYDGFDKDIHSLGLTRGLDHFVQNLPQILDELNTIAYYRKKPGAAELAQEYTEQANSIHTQHVYLLNKALVVINKSPLQTKMQKSLLVFMNIALSLIGLNKRTLSMTSKLNRLGKCLCQLTEFYDEYFRDIMGGKHGGIRTQLYNIRATVAQYNVLTTLTTNIQHPEEIHLPYTSTVHMLYPQLMGKLFKEGYTLQQATSFIQQYTHTFSPKLHQYAEDVLGVTVQEYPDFIYQRFPTLSRGSAPLAKVYKVKTNSRDKSISWSILALRSSNTDADGDAIVVSPCPPYPEYKLLGMKFNMISTENVREMSSNFVLSAPVVTNIYHWMIHSKENSRVSTVDVAALYG